MKSPEPSRFTLQAPLESRGATITWLGTRQAPDCDLTMSLAGLSGEMWVLLRADDALGDSVRIGFSGDHAIVDQEIGRTRHRLAMAPTHVVAELHQGFRARLRLEGSHLSLAVNGRPVIELSDLRPRRSSQGLVRLTVYDKLRGNARADSLEMTLTPLHASEGS